MHWLLAVTLGTTMLATDPRSDASPVRTSPLPRPSGSEIELLLHSPERRVRSTDRRLAKMIELGARRSATFAGLLAAIECTDVIVYIEPAKEMPSKLDGRLLLLPISNNQRYLRIQIRAGLSKDETVPLIGHELQHALEVARSPDIVSAATMAAAYERFGFARNRGRDRVDFDSVAAIETGVTIARELAERDDGE